MLSLLPYGTVCNIYRETLNMFLSIPSSLKTKSGIDKLDNTSMS